MRIEYINVEGVFSQNAFNYPESKTVSICSVTSFRVFFSTCSSQLLRQIWIGKWIIWKAPSLWRVRDCVALRRPPNLTSRLCAAQNLPRGYIKPITSVNQNPPFSQISYVETTNRTLTNVFILGASFFSYIRICNVLSRHLNAYCFCNK